MTLVDHREQVAGRLASIAPSAVPAITWVKTFQQRLRRPDANKQPKGFEGLQSHMAMTALTVITLFLLFGVLIRIPARHLVCRRQGHHHCWLQVVLHPGGRPVPVLRRLPDVSAALAASGWATTTRYRVGYFAWFSMLFSAEHGHRPGVLEHRRDPCITCRNNPSSPEGMTPEAAQIAMRFTFFHWGLHPGPSM